MREIKINLYQYNELSDKAKQKAIEWFRDGNDLFESDHVIDDFKEIAQACGFDENVEADFCGFHVQGEGASFTGKWRAEWVDIDAIVADRPIDFEVDGKIINSDINAEVVRILEDFKTFADLDKQGFGCTVASRFSNYQGETDYDTYNNNLPGNVPEDALLEERTAKFKVLCNDLAAFLFSVLKGEYEYINSDENIAEILDINEYEFLETGEPG